MKPTSVGHAEPYSLDDLKGMTDNFSLKSLIKETMHGRVFRGSTRYRDVTVKTYGFLYPWQKCYVDHPSRFYNELELLMDEKPHSSLMKIRGFCFNHILAVVYDENPTTFLSDELLDSGWYKRVNVVIQLADLFMWLHERKISFGWVDSSTIMIDEDFNIKVFDFGFLTRISEEDDRAPAYYPLFSDAICSDAPEILKAENMSRPRNMIKFESVDDVRSLLDKSVLRVDDEQAHCIREMVAACLERDPKARPSMKDVFDTLSSLGQAGSNSN